MIQSLKITAIRDETDRIRVFTLTAAEGGDLPAYSAGAHLTFELGLMGTRSYSLIDWPGEQDSTRYTIAVQREDAGDGGSQYMHELGVGAVMKAEGPKNDFELRDHMGPALLLAGGIGVTPMIAMATALKAAARPYRFVFAARSAEVMGFGPRAAAELDAELYFDDTKPLDLTALMGTLTPQTHVYICGPRGMIDAARAAATAAGHAQDQIHIELFTTSTGAAEGDTAFEVEIHDTGDVYTIPPGKSIIDVLEEAGLDLMYDCQRGDCGICQTDVISGEPDHRDVVLSEAERAAGDVMQICVSRAKTARLVLDL